MSGVCYPDSLIGTIPNLYYYAANNPSEVSTAKGFALGKLPGPAPVSEASGGREQGAVPRLSPSMSTKSGSPRTAVEESETAGIPHASCVTP
jgi:hypothetical protein